MPRIPLPTAEQLSPAQRLVHDKIIAGRRGRIQGPLRAALHNAELADRWQALGELLRYGTSLSPRLSELAILITGRCCQSPFEWYAHRPEAERAGLPADTIDAILACRQPSGMDETETAVHDYVLQLNQHNSAGAATHARALACLGTQALVELTALVGYYTMVAMTLNAHEIPLPEGVTPAFALPQQAGVQ